MSNIRQKDIRVIINRGEGVKTEFKSSPADPQRIAEIVCSFANAKGGCILIGVADNKQIIGVEIGRQTIERLTDTIVDNSDPKIYPQFSTVKIENKPVIIIKVEESHDKPHSAYGRPFIRVGKTTKPMSRSEYERLLIKRSKTDIQYDSEACPGAKLKDIDWSKVKWFRETYKDITGKAITSTDEKLLEGLGCIRKGRVLNSGILLFGKQPDKFIPQNQITIVRYPGEGVSDSYLDIKDFYGNLFDMIDKADDYIKEHIQIASRLIPGQIPREEIPEYPMYAIRELIVNAVAHRDYFISGSRIIVKMFKGKIEYSSPGGLPAGITPKNIMNRQSSRNPILVKVLNRVKYIEAIGDGIDRIIDAVKAHPMKPKYPVFNDVGNTVIVYLFGADLSTIKEEPKYDLNERQKKLLESLGSEEMISSSSYAEMFSVDERTARRDLVDLVKHCLLNKEGQGYKTVYRRRID
jgi:ATP-dependent DNA helicase RecG